MPAGIREIDCTKTDSALKYFEHFTIYWQIGEIIDISASESSNEWTNWNTGNFSREKNECVVHFLGGLLWKQLSFCFFYSNCANIWIFYSFKKKIWIITLLLHLFLVRIYIRLSIDWGLIGLFQIIILLKYCGKMVKHQCLLFQPSFLFITKSTLTP